MARRRKVGTNTNEQAEENIPSLYEFVDKFKAYILKAQAKKGYLIRTILLIVLLVAGSIALEWFNILTSFLPALVVFPAGVLLFGLVYGKVLQLREKQLEENDGVVPNTFLFYKDNKSFKQRTRLSLFFLAGLLVITALIFNILPYSVGCLFSVLLSCSLALFAIRTEAEEELAMQGVPDPRDLKDDEDEEEDEYLDDDYYEEESEDEEQDLLSSMLLHDDDSDDTISRR